MLARKFLAASLGAILGAGFISVAATPAQAYEERSVAKSGWAYTDSKLPTESFINPAGDAPVGAWTGPDGKTRMSRSYFTFDVARFRGTRIHKADLVIAERTAADCATPQPVELWRTDPLTPTTSWAETPHRRELLGTVLAGGAAACPGYLTWDVMPALQKLANDNEQTLTVEIRVPYGQESDLDHGRTLRPFPSIHTIANHAPTVQRIGLEFPQWACGTNENPQPVAARTNTLVLQGADADTNDFSFQGQFAAWPVGQEEQRSEQFGGSYYPKISKVGWDMSQYPHGTIVAWTARGYDGHDYSDWADPCYVKVDSQAPAEPVVSSATYPNDGQPHGGEGVPGTFVFHANGSADVVGYYWGRFGETYHYVPAPAMGADASMEYTPTSYVEFLSVRSVDSAGNSSPVTRYTFYVRSTAPQVQVTVGGVGLPSRLAISTDVEGVTEFGYRIGDGAETRVPANSGGTANVEIVFSQTGYIQVQVRSYAAGELVGGYTEEVLVQDLPFVESTDFAFPDHDGVVGREGSFTFRPGRTGVVAYEYAFNYDELRRIDAGTDGAAVLRWTPAEPNWYMLNVRSISADGTVSQTAQYQFNVIDTRPSVYSSTYYEYGAWGGVGIAGDFSFDTAMPDVDVYVYQLNGGPEQIVDPEYSWAQVSLAPDRPGSNTLTVRTRFMDGSFSPAYDYVFEVSDAPVVTSTDYPEETPAGQPGQPGQFTFNPGRSDVVEYRYMLEYSGEEHVVAAGPDGKATVEITPTHPGYTLLTVASRSADGTITAERWYFFVVRDPHVRVYSAYNEYSPRGGIGSVGTFSFSSELDEVSSYEYQLNGGSWQSVPRTPNSNTTQVSVTMDRNGENVLSVRGRTTAGDPTPQTDYPFLVGTAPLVSSTVYPAGQWSGGVGVAGEFTFTQGSSGVVEFEYTVNYGTPVLVPATDGVATATYTPSASGSHTMRVRGRMADGRWTDTIRYDFYVRSV